MLKWVVGILVLLVIVGVALVFGAYRYVVTNINNEGTGAAAAYETYVKQNLTAYCTSFYEHFPPSGEMNSDTQFENACDCFAGEMFEKYRDLPSDQVNAFAEQPETKKTMQVIMEKCANQYGLY